MSASVRAPRRTLARLCVLRALALINIAGPGSRAHSKTADTTITFPAIREWG
jgi:hypothetical protein